MPPIVDNAVNLGNYFRPGNEANNSQLWQNTLQDYIQRSTVPVSTAVTAPSAVSMTPVVSAPTSITASTSINAPSAI
ncbi:hypothetical protein HDU79_002096, partial [Rhizoclosmatium sp. JEL0117]